MGTSLAADREGASFVGPDDRFMVNLPMFHVGGTAPTYAMLVAGGSIALLEAFDTASFWRTVEATQTTVVILLGVMASFLVKEPVRPASARRRCATPSSSPSRRRASPSASASASPPARSST